MAYFLFSLLLIYTLLLAMLFVMQRKILYFPQKESLMPASFGLHDFHKISLTTQDGVTITGWFAEAEEGFPTLLYFHGNAGHIGGRAQKLNMFHEAGFGILGVSYRGYGDSKGSPSEKGLYADARAAFDYLANDRGLQPQQIMLYGESLGSGVAVQLASEHPDLAMLILEAPYISVEQRAQELYTIVPVRLLLKDKFHSLKKLPDVAAPILIFHGELDETIPARHGRIMLESAPGKAHGKFFSGTGHNDFPMQEIIREINAFRLRLQAE
jgi:fermentation-respiration switch protein FrsA (DUF1100 family)